MEVNFSIIITTYKRPNNLERCINSILKQDYDNYEILIIDDNNSESSHREETEKLIHKINRLDKIKYIKHEKNLGACAARNTGIKNSKGKYICFLDDDDEWQKNKLSKINEIMDYNYPIILSNYFIVDENKRKILYKINFKHNFKEELQKGNILLTTSILVILKEIIIEYMFDENLEAGQEWELLYRLSNNYNVHVIDEPLVIKNNIETDRISNNLIKKANAFIKILKKHESNCTKQQYYYLSNIIAGLLYHANEKEKCKIYLEQCLRYKSYNLKNIVKYVLIKFKR